MMKPKTGNALVKMISHRQESLCDQSGLMPVIERLNKASRGKVTFLDLRKEVFRQTTENFMVRTEAPLFE